MARQDRMTFEEACAIAHQERAGAFPDPDPVLRRILDRARRVETRGLTWDPDPRRRRQLAIALGLGAVGVCSVAVALVAPAGLL